MRALILLAHPELRSFNAYLAAQAAEQLRHDALQVDVVDLYAEGFDPLEAAHHHSRRLQPTASMPSANSVMAPNRPGCPPMCSVICSCCGLRIG